MLRQIWRIKLRIYTFTEIVRKVPKQETDKNALQIYIFLNLVLNGVKLFELFILPLEKYLIGLPNNEQSHLFIWDGCVDVWRRWKPIFV